VINEVSRLIDLEMVDHVAVDEDERVVADVLDVPDRARVEVVHTDDAVACLHRKLASPDARNGSLGPLTVARLEARLS
jgi:hypothetical protein